MQQILISLSTVFCHWLLSTAHKPDEYCASYKITLMYLSGYNFSIVHVTESAKRICFDTVSVIEEVK
jgi:hypothetical protein